MELRILSAYNALIHNPDKPTVVIRIYSADPERNLLYDKLEHPSYVRIFPYTFDDWRNLTADQMHGLATDSDFRNEFLTKPEDPRSFLSRDLAMRLVMDFLAVRESIECLMIHCAYGEGRAPAVGIALNEVFSLGCSTAQLKELFPSHNRGVYSLVLEAAWRALDIV